MHAHSGSQYYKELKQVDLLLPGGKKFWKKTYLRRKIYLHLWQSQVETEHYSSSFFMLLLLLLFFGGGGGGGTSSHHNSAYKGDQRLKCRNFNLSSKHTRGLGL